MDTAKAAASATATALVTEQSEAVPGEVAGGSPETVTEHHQSEAVPAKTDLSSDSDEDAANKTAADLAEASREQLVELAATSGGGLVLDLSDDDSDDTNSSDEY